MFASLKNKIKDETGNDLSKLTSSWRTGAFLGRMSLRDDSSTASPSSSGGQGDTNSDSLSPQLESYLSERTGGQVDQTALQQQYAQQLEIKLKERDAFWEQRIEEMKLTLASAQGEEAVAAQTVARTAQAEAARAAAERDAAEKQLAEFRVRLHAAERAQERLDDITEELEQARREWGGARAELAAGVAAADARAADAAHQLQLARAALPPDHPAHHMHDDDKRDLPVTGCEDYDRVCREKAVLSRQLLESKMALADVKTSWSGQIASLETQVARLSRQAGEEGAERRRVEIEKKDLHEKIIAITTELEKTKQSLINSEAKVVRLNGEVHSLAMEVKSLRSSASHAGEKKMELEKRVEELVTENRELVAALENERTLVGILRGKLDASTQLSDDQKTEVNHLNSTLTEIQHDYVDMQRKFDKERREKDEALLRNAEISQSLELSQCNVRYHQDETHELRAKIQELETVIAQHKENQAVCMLIKENDKSRKEEIENLNKQIESITESEDSLKRTIQELEAEICDKNKKIKTLDNRLSDMKKTLQRELQTTKSDLNAAEEQDISRRYLKHVVLRFLTARELEARQLTRALAALLRLSAHEEALLRAALPPRTGIAAWFPSNT